MIRYVIIIKEGRERVLYSNLDRRTTFMPKYFFNQNLNGKKDTKNQALKNLVKLSQFFSLNL